MGLLYLYFNFLEPSGPLQAGNGTALPLPAFTDILVVFVYFLSFICFIH